MHFRSGTRKTNKGGSSETVVALQERIQDVSREYEVHTANGTELELLRTLGHSRPQLNESVQPTFI